MSFAAIKREYLNDGLDDQNYIGRKKVYYQKKKADLFLLFLIFMQSIYCPKNILFAWSCIYFS